METKRTEVLARYKEKGLEALGAVLDRITPAELKGTQRDSAKPCEGEQALRAMDRMARELGRALKESAEVRVALGSRLLFANADAAKEYFAAYVDTLRLSDDNQRQDSKSGLLARFQDVVIESLPGTDSVVINTIPTGNGLQPEVLGEGGNATVFAGTYRKGSPEERQIVVKKLKNHRSKQQRCQVANYIGEVVMHGRLHDEPLIPRIIGVYFDDEDDTNLVIERVRGTNATEFFERHESDGELADASKRAKVALHIFAGCVGAFDALARQGIIHRDVKPKNVMLDEDSLQARLIDFGTAGPASEEAISATPRYSSPEAVAMPRNVTPQSDIYSLGSALYSLLGWTPWGNKGVIQVTASLKDPDQTPGDFETVVTRKYDPDQKVDVTKTEKMPWPKDLEAVKALILACWNHNPADRPTPSQMLRALRGEAAAPVTEDQIGLKADKVGVLDVLMPDHPLRQDPEGILRRLVGAK